VGQDLNGDSLYNDRPAFATDLSRPSVVHTQFGVFDTAPLPGQAIIPPYLGDAPNQFTMNLRASKTFKIQKKPVEAPASGGDSGGHEAHGPVGGHDGGGGAAPAVGGYALTFSASVRNILNYVNIGSPVGNLASPLFGRSNSLAGGPFSSSSSNRRIDLQMVFSF
jgi:hypothetical protein